MSNGGLCFVSGLFTNSTNILDASVILAMTVSTNPSVGYVVFVARQFLALIGKGSTGGSARASQDGSRRWYVMTRRRRRFAFEYIGYNETTAGQR